MVTQHTYLFGSDGFFTERYDLTLFVLGSPKIFTDLSKQELQQYINMYTGVIQDQAYLLQTVQNNNLLMDMDISQ